MDWAIRIWQAAQIDNASLVVCGLTSNQIPEWRKRIEPALSDKFIYLPFVAEEDMPGLYNHAQATIYPSLYEGFGFPALESQAAGTPVLMSPLGSLKELAGPGSILLPPYDAAAWTDAIISLAKDKPPNMKDARKWATQFTWSAAFSKLYHVYQQAIIRS